MQPIRVANVGQFSIFNLIAKQNGYFAQNGLDATVTEFASGAPSVAALINGEADVAVAADFVGVTNLFNQKDLRILATVSEHDVFRVVARRDKGISRPADLKGRKIGVTKKTAGEFYLGRFLTLNQVALADVQTVDRTPDEMIEQIESGALDAVLIFEPHAYNIQKALGAGVVVWSAQGDQRALGLAYTTQTYIDAHPQELTAYMRSLVQAEDYVRTHNQEAKAFVTQKLGYDPEYMNTIWPKFTFAISLNQDLLLTLENQARWSIEQKLTTQKITPNYLDVIDFDPLQTVRPSSVTIVH